MFIARDATGGLSPFMGDMYFAPTELRVISSFEL